MPKTDSFLFSGIAITAYAHVVPLQAPIDAHAVTRWWLQLKDKGLVSLLVGLKKFLARLGVYSHRQAALWSFFHSLAVSMLD